MMAIPKLSKHFVDEALSSLVSKLPKLRADGHDSTKYDLDFNGILYPPKVVIAKAIELQYGQPFSTREFSGGIGPGQANTVLQKLGYLITPKPGLRGALPLVLHSRYGRKEAFALFGLLYNSQQQHLNLGLSPRLNDGGYFIFITLNKEDLDPVHDYDDQLFADRFIWVTRRDVTEDHADYVRLREAETRVSLFVRAHTREDFVYAGELAYEDHQPFLDEGSGRPQIRFAWRLCQPLEDSLLEQLTFGMAASSSRKKQGTNKMRVSRFRAPSSFDEFKKAFSYAVGSAPDRTVVPEHQHYQVLLSAYLKKKGVKAEFERDFVDVAFDLSEKYIGEIKVTRNLTLPQAFRSALGQVLEYGYMRFEKLPRMIVFLDQLLDHNRLRVADALGIVVITAEDNNFKMLNPQTAPTELQGLFDLGDLPASSEL